MTGLKLRSELAKQLKELTGYKGARLKQEYDDMSQEEKDYQAMVLKIRQEHPRWPEDPAWPEIPDPREQQRERRKQHEHSSS